MDQQKRTTKQTAEDLSLPNTARIYDYFLGGTHNTAVDRAAAEAIIAHLPSTRFITRTLRACLKDVAHELVRRGFDLIIDFASGLPTQDHLHMHVPESTVVVYNDLDPVVVQYAHAILGKRPNVAYFQGDMRQPRQILAQPQVQQWLAEGRKAAFVIWGVSLYLSDEELASIAQTLYACAQDETCWAFNATLADMNVQNQGFQQVLEYYATLNEPFHVRSLADYRRLLAPWHPDEHGFVSMYDWHGITPAQTGLSDDDHDAMGGAGGGYGVYLVKAAPQR